MNALRWMLALALLPLCAAGYAQSAAKPAAPSDAQQSFDLIKSLAGDWQGPVTTDNAAMSTDKPLNITMRVVSRGNALVWEMKENDVPELTVFYVDGDRLTMVHYCDYANRPVMVARPVANGKTVEFDLVSNSGSNQFGHVTHAVFTAEDAGHHIEDWNFSLPDGTIVHAHFDLKRVQ